MGVKRIYNDDSEGLAKLRELNCCETEHAHQKLFKYQSPIDLRGLTDVKIDKSLALDFNYGKQVFEQIIFANAFHLVPMDKVSYLNFEGLRYDLVDIHVHFPSEHIIEETNSEFEVHFVHDDHEGHKLVVGVLFNTAPAEFIIKNELRRHVIMDEFLGQGEIFFNPEKYIPKNSTFFHLIGSLTTPPYSGPVLWFVMDTIAVANRKMVDLVKQNVPINNNRHPYPLAKRQVWHN